MENKFSKNVSLYTIGQFLSQALSFVLLPIYINQLSVDEYGVVAVFMAVGTFLNALMQYGFSPTLMRYYFDFKENPKMFKSFFSSLLLFLFGGNIIILFLIYIVHNFVYKFTLSSADVSTYIYYVIGYSFFFTFPLLNLSLFRVEGKAKKYFIFNLVQFFISFGVIYYFVVIQKDGALGKIKGEFWARLPLFLVSFYLYRNYFTLKGLDFSYLKRALNFGIPLMFQSLLWWSLYRLDYFLIEKELGSTSLGLYNVAFQISFVVITLGISYSLAWTPHFFSIAKEKTTPKFYGNLMGNYFMFLTIVSIGIYFLGYHVLEIIGGEKYLEIFEFLPWLLIGAIFQSGYYLIHQTIQYSKKTWSIPAILGIGIFVGFGLEYMFINKLELLGISIIKVITFSAIFVLTYLKGQSYYKIKIPRNKIIVALIILIVNFSIGYILDYNVTSFIIKLFTLIISILGLWFFLPFFSEEEKRMILKKLKRT
ncbi:lipopolysaccharide biosynthesis protein [Ichthyenterobacterium magnum]|uniref:O-antigen/teichoic acid export membrane protein n=1 Tax=Ichthyenterobacterium magnum TaxID=1230530 RepID=A0A420DX94_9FLAO|nr:oligosaccharide flippase family protein [Ichthyenterobacterium magnum]RKE98833.1 O-antigen/teichoic acid export membrane protein [Ichthyenterobacterium magnum]